MFSSVPFPKAGGISCAEIAWEIFIKVSTSNPYIAF